MQGRFVQVVISLTVVGVVGLSMVSVGVATHLTTTRDALVPLDWMNAASVPSAESTGEVVTCADPVFRAQSTDGTPPLQPEQRLFKATIVSSVVEPSCPVGKTTKSFVQLAVVKLAP